MAELKLIPKADGFDAAAMRQHWRERPAQLFVQELKDRHGQLLGQLKNAISWDDTLKLQARIQEIEGVLALPDQLVERAQRRDDKPVYKRERASD